MGAAPDSLLSRDMLDEVAKHAEDPPDLQGQPARIRGATVFAWLVGVGAALPSLLSAQAASHSAGSILTLAIFGPFALFGLLAGLLMLRTDLLTPSFRDRRRPELAVRCFLRMVERRNWSRAFSLVTPIAIGNTLVRPSISKLDVDAETLQLQQPEDLARYWSPILDGDEGTDRRLSRIKIREIDAKGPLHYLQVTLHLRLFPSWGMACLRFGLWPLLPVILLATERQTLEFEIPTLKHKSQWWMASAGIIIREP